MYTLKEILIPYWPTIWKLIVLYLMVLFAVLLDLRAGIKKSKKIHAFHTHTYGIRQTINKLKNYYNLLAIVTVFDTVVIVCNMYSHFGLDDLIPYATFLATVILCIVEFRSIWEKDEHKGKYLEAMKMAKNIAGSVDLDVLADTIIKKMEEKQHDKTKT